MALLFRVHGGADRTGPGLGEEVGVLGDYVGTVDARAVHVFAVFLIALLTHHLAPDLSDGRREVRAA